MEERSGVNLNKTLPFSLMLGVYEARRTTSVCNNREKEINENVETQSHKNVKTFIRCNQSGPCVAAITNTADCFGI